MKISSQGLGWKSTKTGEVETVEGSLISKANWLQLGPEKYEVELGLKGGAAVKFDGFKQQVRRRKKFSFLVEQHSYSKKGFFSVAESFERQLFC